MDRINLFLLPFAGGSKYSYNNYIRLCPPALSIVPVELPGRGSRLGEPLLRSIDQMVEDVFRQIGGNLGQDYAIFGHSMGSYLAFLLTHKIRNAGLRMPRHLFISGSSGPSIPDDGDPTYLLPYEQFVTRLRSLGGSTDEVLGDTGIMEFYEPILRADFQVVETFKYSKLPKLDLPITLFTGLEENISEEEAMAWGSETNGAFNWMQYSGKHFFIFENDKDILDVIVKTLTQK